MLRFAPSPSGEMDIDTLRIAIVNYLVAKQRSEPFLIRLDDTEKAKIIEGKDTEIMQILEKFAITHDQVYHQSEHQHIHQTLAIRLLQEGKAFVCTCGEETESCQNDCETMDRSAYSRLKENGEPFVIRIKAPETKVVFHDLLKGKISTEADKVGSFVILNTDGTPTSDFATASDDMLNSISLIIRKEAHLSRTARQKHIQTMLGYAEETRYAHLAPIQGTEDEILLIDLFREGFIPDAIVNYLLLISNTGTEEEIFTLPDGMTWFDLAAVPISPVKFDMEKLRFINREHIRRMDERRLSTLFGFADPDIGHLAKLYLDEASTVTELERKIKPIFEPKSFEGTDKEKMHAIRQVLENAPMFRTFDELEEYVTQKTGLSKSEFSQPLRLLLTGSPEGPELSDIYPYIRSYLLEVIS